MQNKLIATKTAHGLLVGIHRVDTQNWIQESWACSKWWQTKLPWGRITTAHYLTWTELDQ